MFQWRGQLLLLNLKAQMLLCRGQLLLVSLLRHKCCIAEVFYLGHMDLTSQ